MTREQIMIALEECREQAKLDFALDKALECCQTCTWAEIENQYGEDAKGIWVKWFETGMNATAWCEEKNYIAHDLREWQKQVVYDVLSKHFQVEWDLSDSKCILIKNK